MKKKIIFLWSFLISISLFDCCKKGDEVIIPEIPKDPRTYSWTLDTVSFPNTFQTWMSGIWGYSPQDLYLVGYSSEGDYMYHFDGKKWQEIVLSAAKGGIISGSFSLTNIIGFSNNDIWVAGIRDHTNPSPPPNFIFSNILIHYNGLNWQEINIPNGNGLNTIWGNSSNNIFTAGVGKLIWHYDGHEWKKDSLPVTLKDDMQFVSTSISGNVIGDVFLNAISHENIPRDILYFFIYSNGKWSLKDSTIIELKVGINEKRWGDSQFWVSPEGNLFSVRPFYKWDGIKWNLLNSSLNRAFCIFGSSEKNIFVAGIFGEIYHYNGSNWQQITQLFNKDITYYGIWCDDKEAFIMGHLGGKTVVLHGK